MFQKKSKAIITSLVLAALVGAPAWTVTSQAEASTFREKVEARRVETQQQRQEGMVYRERQNTQKRQQGRQQGQEGMAYRERQDTQKRQQGRQQGQEGMAYRERQDAQNGQPGQNQSNNGGLFGQGARPSL